MLNLFITGTLPTLVETPGFSAAREKDPQSVIDFMERALAALGREADSQPSMCFGFPEVKGNQLEDLTEMDDGTEQYLSVGIPAPVQLWLKRDDYPEGPVFTFLLPSEY